MATISTPYMTITQGAEAAENEAESETAVDTSAVFAAKVAATVAAGSANRSLAEAQPQR